MMNWKRLILSGFVCAASVFGGWSGARAEEDAYDGLTPYRGGYAAEEKRVPNETMHGKVMCGYQGWFTADGDGSPRQWVHYGNGGKFEPGNAVIDLWPDMAEMDADEKYPTAFRHHDGSVASVFSSQNPKTVRRHFQWMQDYGMDGVFLQRFPAGQRDAAGLKILNNVLVSVQRSANETGRCWALMYDLSGQRSASADSSLVEDWKKLCEKMRLGEDPADRAYLRHNGKPVVAVWGIGFNDGRRYSLEECRELVQFLKEDPQYGGFAVMIGVPAYWRERKNDALDDLVLHEIAKMADVVSPWTIGRYGTPEHAENFIRTHGAGDLAWCREQGNDYLPVVFPGFSWQNLSKTRGRTQALNAIPRLKGTFLETQYVENKKIGAVMVYQAMFDEIDEGTAIFKCTNSPPGAPGDFADYEGLPSDFYLKMVGRWTAVFRGVADSKK